MIVKWHLKYIICTKWSTHLSRPEIDNTLYWSNKAFSSMVSLKIYAFVWIYPLSLSWISLYIVIISCNVSKIFWFMSNNNWTRLRITIDDNYSNYTNEKSRVDSTVTLLSWQSKPILHMFEVIRNAKTYKRYMYP